LGLTDWYRSQAAEFAAAGFVGLAVDLFPGQLAWDLDGEQRLISEAFGDARRMTENLVDWVDWLRCDPRTNGKVGIVGWSFGAWWALRASIAAAPEATVLYYGLKYGHPGVRERETRELSQLKGPLLAHFGSFDTSIRLEQIDQSREELNAVRKSIEVDWYPANNGFADMTLDGYDRAAATAAWKRSIEFLRTSLASSPALADGALRGTMIPACIKSSRLVADGGKAALAPKVLGGMAGAEKETSRNILVSSSAIALGRFTERLQPRKRREHAFDLT
jgi:carboxymethylenebutenolidase